MDKFIDLHTHTFHSDGIITPNNLIDLAKQKNVGVLSITDHNTISAYRCIDKRKLEGFQLLTGVEISANFFERDVHILAYGFDLNNYELNKFFLENNKYNELRLNAYLHFFETHSIDFPQDAIKKILAYKHDVSAESMQNFLTLYNRAYCKEQINNAKKHVSILYPFKKESVENIISLIHKADGVAILAHPFKYNFNELELDYIFKKFKEIKLDGIECYHSNSSASFTKDLLNYAEKYSFLISGGSDAHTYYMKKPNSREFVSGINNNLNLTASQLNMGSLFDKPVQLQSLELFQK